MTHKLILRVPAGLELSDAFLATLRADLGDFEIERYTERHDFTGSYERRQESLCNGVRQLAKTFPPIGRSMESIEEMLLGLRMEYRSPDFGLCARYQDRLVAFTAALVAEMAKIDPWRSLLQQCQGNPARLLDRAEQYAILENDTPDIATLQRIEANGRVRYTVQYDRQLSALSPALERDFDAILKHCDKAMPIWFADIGKEMHPAWQEYIAGLGAEVTAVTDLMEKATALKEALAGVPGMRLPALLEAIKSGKVAWPASFEKLSAGERLLITRLIQEKGASLAVLYNELRRFDEKLNVLTRRDKALFAEEMTRVREVPLAFYYMPAYEQKMLIKVLESGKPESAPSRLRSVDMTVNAAEHFFQIRNESGVLLKVSPPAIRFGHLATRDKLQQPKLIQERHALANLEHMLSLAGSRPVLLQTLISPIYTGDFTPDYTLDKVLSEVVKQVRAKDPSRELVFANHPFNIVKKIPGFWTPNDYAPGKALLHMVRLRLTESAVQGALLSAGETGSGAEAIRNLIAVQTRFINANRDVAGAWNLMRSIIPKLPVVLSELEPEELENMLNRAFEEASRRQMGLAFGVAPDTDVQMALNDVISAHFGQLRGLADCREFFKASLMLPRCGQPEQLMRLSPFVTHCGNQAILANEYERTLSWNMLPVTATVNDTVGRELMLASQEQLLMDGIGIPMGSCVSGKDRKGIVLVHSDAMRLYHDLYGQWPSSMDTGVERKNFVALVVKLYVSRHPAVFAGLGALGAEGIKTPWDYFPADISEGIIEYLGNEAALYFDEVLATNNDVHHIRSRKFVEKMPDEVCIARAELLSPEGTARFLSALKPAIHRLIANVQQTWTGSLFGGPRGAVSMLESLTGPALDETHRLGAIYRDVMSRLGERSRINLRAQETSVLYDAVARLFESDTPDAILESVLYSLNSATPVAAHSGIEHGFLPEEDDIQGHESDGYQGGGFPPSSSSSSSSSSASSSSMPTDAAPYW
ncbi:hypothetical protein E3226_005190 [Legionella geestiana]|uniref:hypothetical protein n=1 Tax=Legionella geestiana TaxID=45065 RepID=UPI001092D10B|nr:hypothetical protein [Legionella geestiana]QDQ39830.1 hypothetical protein E3226_005190 [Legionella geestiana]